MRPRHSRAPLSTRPPGRATIGQGGKRNGFHPGGSPRPCRRGSAPTSSAGRPSPPRPFSSLQHSTAAGAGGRPPPLSSSPARAEPAAAATWARQRRRREDAPSRGAPGAESGLKQQPCHAAPLAPPPTPPPEASGAGRAVAAGGPNKEVKNAPRRLWHLLRLLATRLSARSHATGGARRDWEGPGGLAASLCADATPKMRPRGVIDLVSAHVAPRLSGGSFQAADRKSASPPLGAIPSAAATPRPARGRECARRAALHEACARNAPKPICSASPLGTRSRPPARRRRTLRRCTNSLRMAAPRSLRSAHGSPCPQTPGTTPLPRPRPAGSARIFKFCRGSQPRLPVRRCCRLPLGLHLSTGSRRWILRALKSSPGSASKSSRRRSGEGPTRAQRVGLETRISVAFRCKHDS